jgi:hypothetical protein
MDAHDGHLLTDDGDARSFAKDQDVAVLGSVGCSWLLSMQRGLVRKCGRMALDVDRRDRLLRSLSKYHGLSMTDRPRGLSRLSMTVAYHRKSIEGIVSTTPEGITCSVCLSTQHRGVI